MPPKIPERIEHNSDTQTLLALMNELGNTRLFMKVFFFLQGEREFIDVNGVGNRDVVALMQTFVELVAAGELSSEKLLQSELDYLFLDDLVRKTT